MEDREIVELYWARSETAIAETNAKYGRYCHYIAYQIVNSDADAEEIVNDTYLKAWQSIPPKRPTSLKSYVGMICRRLAYNVWTAGHAQKRTGELPGVLSELAECIPDGDSGTDLGESLALRDALNTFVRTLAPRTQQVFVQRYWYAMPITEIAAACDMRENNVRVLLFQTRKKLKYFLEKEGFPL